MKRRRPTRGRRQEPLPVKGHKLDCHHSGRASARGAPLQEAAQAARSILLGPVVGDRSYDDEITFRYQQASEIVTHWPGLGHRERIALNRGLPWEQAVHLVWEAKRPRTDLRRKAV